MASAWANLSKAEQQQWIDSGQFTAGNEKKEYNDKYGKNTGNVAPSPPSSNLLASPLAGDFIEVDTPVQTSTSTATLAPPPATTPSPSPSPTQSTTNTTTTTTPKSTTTSTQTLQVTPYDSKWSELDTSQKEMFNNDKSAYKESKNTYQQYDSKYSELNEFEKAFYGSKTDYKSQKQDYQAQTTGPELIDYSDPASMDYTKMWSELSSDEQSAYKADGGDRFTYKAERKDSGNYVVGEKNDFTGWRELSSDQKKENRDLFGGRFGYNQFHRQGEDFTKSTVDPGDTPWSELSDAQKQEAKEVYGGREGYRDAQSDAQQFLGNYISDMPTIQAPSTEAGSATGSGPFTGTVDIAESNQTQLPTPGNTQTSTGTIGGDTGSVTLTDSSNTGTINTGVINETSGTNTVTIPEQPDNSYDYEGYQSGNYTFQAPSTHHSTIASNQQMYLSDGGVGFYGSPEVRPYNAFTGQEYELDENGLPKYNLPYSQGTALPGQVLPEQRYSAYV